MLGQLFTYKGEEIPYTKTQALVAGWIADIIWTDVIVENSSISKQTYHGSVSNPTFARERLIQITGEIYSTAKTSRGTIRNILDDLFALEGFPSQGEGFYPLTFTDDDGTLWTIQAKVYNKIEYRQDRGSKIINFAVNLLAEDPVILGASIKTATSTYGTQSGLSLPTTLPVSMDSYEGEFQVINSGNFISSPVITITGDITNPKIFNITTGRFWKMTIDMNPADVLIINTKTATALLNGINALANRATGSQWIFINPGINMLVLLGDDYNPGDPTKASVLVEYYDSKI